MVEQLDTTEENPKSKLLRSHVLSNGLTFDSSRYEYSDEFVPANSFLETHTTNEMLEQLQANPLIELDAKVIAVSAQEGKKKSVTLTRDKFLETFKENNKKSFKFREGTDPFLADEGNGSAFTGNDFVPLIGGPFYKNLYYYQDYIRMHSASFYAYHHDPIAKAIVNITKDFVLGRGYRIDSDNKEAMGYWKAFEAANDIQTLCNNFVGEECIYGENIIWKLPDNETKITYQLKPGQSNPKGVIPRVRLIDPSNIVEIITYPEDISRKLAYVWLAPTQYQIYTGSGPGSSATQPVLKFIYRQIPADQMLHYKINSVSNEKRGRSDFYPVLGYMKKLRDSVDYALIGAQKQSAWAIDTSVDGSQPDIDAYASSQAQLGTITQAGSEFIHSTRIKREFLSPAAGSKGQSAIFEWCLSMIAAGVNIPVSYFGTHLSGGQTRASALVSTEPVAKKFEMRQYHVECLLKDLWDYCMEWAGLDADCEVTFPEIITQDRSAKLKDLALAETQGWMSKRRCAEITAKEFGVSEYNYDEEKLELKQDPPQDLEQPLTKPGMDIPDVKPSAVTGEEKARIAQNDGA